MRKIINQVLLYEVPLKSFWYKMLGSTKSCLDLICCHHLQSSPFRSSGTDPNNASATNWMHLESILEMCVQPCLWFKFNFFYCIKYSPLQLNFQLGKKKEIELSQVGYECMDKKQLKCCSFAKNCSWWKWYKALHCHSCATLLDICFSHYPLVTG